MNYARKDAKAYSRRTMTGICAAALAPFTPSLAIDEEGFRRNIDHWVEDLKIDGFFIAGKQGEFFSMSLDERKRVFDLAVDACAGRGQTIMSCSDQNMDVVIALARHAQAIGADYIVVHAPVLHFLKAQGETLLNYYRGIVFSNVAGAAVPEILDAGAFYVSANAGPSNFAGKDCNPNYFVVSWQNDNLHESAGQLANNLGYKKAFVLAPNYQAGKDAIAGFRRVFKGEVVGEVYTRLDQTDFAPEMAQIRAAGPDVVFQFHPGGVGIAFLRQYEQAGLSKTIPMVVAAPSMDAVILKTVGDAALGLNVASHWNADFDNAASKAFVAAFRKTYGREPTYYAIQGYDAARLIASALAATRGDLANADAFRAALRKADFQSVRGAFRFGPNQHPIQDWYALKVEKDQVGKLTLKTVGKLFSDHADAYAPQCKM